MEDDDIWGNRQPTQQDTQSRTFLKQGVIVEAAHTVRNWISFVWCCDLAYWRALTHCTSAGGAWRNRMTERKIHLTFCVSLSTTIVAGLWWGFSQPIWLPGKNMWDQCVERRKIELTQTSCNSVTHYWHKSLDNPLTRLKYLTEHWLMRVQSA